MVKLARSYVKYKDCTLKFEINFWLKSGCTFLSVYRFYCHYSFGFGYRIVEVYVLNNHEELTNGI